jgi:hypothetical protein
MILIANYHRVTKEEKQEKTIFQSIKGNKDLLFELLIFVVEAWEPFVVENTLLKSCTNKRD